MISKDRKEKSYKDKDSPADTPLPLLEAIAMLEAATLNYNNAYNSYQEEVYFYEMQAAKARISLALSYNKCGR